MSNEVYTRLGIKVYYYMPEEFWTRSVKIRFTLLADSGATKRWSIAPLSQETLEAEVNRVQEALTKFGYLPVNTNPFDSPDAPFVVFKENQYLRYWHFLNMVCLDFFERHDTPNTWVAETTFNVIS